MDEVEFRAGEVCLGGDDFDQRRHSHREKFFLGFHARALVAGRRLRRSESTGRIDDRFCGGDDRAGDLAFLERDLGFRLLEVAFLGEDGAFCGIVAERPSE